MSNMEKFILRTKDLPPDPLLVEALNFFKKQKTCPRFGLGRNARHEVFGQKF